MSTSMPLRLLLAGVSHLDGGRRRDPPRARRGLLRLEAARAATSRSPRSRPAGVRAAWRMAVRGVPAKTSSPPASRPRAESTSQSLAADHVELCSMTTSEWPAAMRRRNAATAAFATSSKCRPVVGSSKRKRRVLGGRHRRGEAPVRRCRRGRRGSIATGRPDASRGARELQALRLRRRKAWAPAVPAAGNRGPRPRAAEAARPRPPRPRRRQAPRSP